MGEACTPPALARAQALYVWLVRNSATLARTIKRGEVRTPRLELRAYPDGSVASYDVLASFFVENPVFVPVALLPDEFKSDLAALADSDHRTEGFATVKPAAPGSSVLVFRHFVWDHGVDLVRSAGVRKKKQRLQRRRLKKRVKASP